MKVLLPFLVPCLFCISFHTTAQNLVSNPGFEQLNVNPKRGDLTITCSQDWFASYMMGTDYFNRSSTKKNGVPKNELGYQESHSGDAYAGICIDREFIEYLQVQLLDTLKEGKKYRVEFYISRAEKSKSSLKEFGVLFSDKANKAIGSSGIAKQPSVEFTSPLGYRDKKGWTKLSAVYEAKGFESYLILGHFTYDHPEYRGKYCHYYVDDVSITAIESEHEEKTKK